MTTETRPTGRPITMPGHLGHLARAVCGMQALSTVLRTPPRTIRGWANGSPIPGAAQVAIESLCDEHSITYPARTSHESLGTLTHP